MSSPTNSPRLGGALRGADDVHTIVVVTASTETQARAVERELAARQQLYPNVVFYAVPDPSNARVGSGGATFNALITCEELISSTPNWSLDRCRVFMIHSGGDSQRLPCQSVTGKAWSALPTYNRAFELDAPIDLLLTTLFDLFKDVRAGLVVASSDVLLLIPPGFPAVWHPTGATGLAIPTAPSYGPHHGVYQVVPGGGSCAQVAKFWQKPSVGELRDAPGAVRPDGTILIDTGVIYFSPPATSRLLEVARTYPLDCCTYLGLDMDRRPLRVELYSDMMMAMGAGMGLTFEQYLATPTSDASPARIAAARDILWARLADVDFYATVIEGGGFAHVGTTEKYLALLTAPSPFAALYSLRAKAAWFQEGRAVRSTAGCDDAHDDGAEPHAGHSLKAADAGRTFTVLNSLLHSDGHKGRGSVVEHAELAGRWHVGAGSLVSAVRSVRSLVVRDGIAAQELAIAAGGSGGGEAGAPSRRVISLLGISDPIKDPHTKAGAVVCGAPWSAVFQAGGVSAGAIWPGVESASGMTIWTAKLFPVFDAPKASVDAGEAGEGSLYDRASLWLQWVAPAAALAAGADPASIDSGLDAAALRAAVDTYLAPEVVAAWRSATRLSLRDILQTADASVEFAWRRAIRGKIDVRLLVGAVAQGDDAPVAELVKRLGRSTLTLTSVASGVGTVLEPVAPPDVLSADHAWTAMRALRGLDAVAASAAPDIAGRALAVQSALLWSMAGWGSHGHRSGPAHNAAWLPAFALLEGDAGWAGGKGGPASAAAALAARKRGVALLATLRDEWLRTHRAHLIGRAARHYERAAQLLTAQCIFTAPVAAPASAPAVPVGTWVTATAPARVDLAGGWSDTPPITFEASGGAGRGAGPAKAMSLAAKLGEAAAAVASLITGGDHHGASANDEAGASLRAIEGFSSRGGGLVVNVGIKMHGVAALGARVRSRRVAPGDAATVTIRTRSDAAASAASGAPPGAVGPDGAPGKVVGEVTLRAAADLSDYNQPRAEGALVKCALLCLGVVRLPVGSGSLGSAGGGGGLTTPRGSAIGAVAVDDVPPLTDQLTGLVGGSLEIETWSLIPHGSGLGGSSVLAAVVLAALGRALGRVYDHASLIHMTLKLEQMLTTGGGWQDQVGGIYPGVKASACPASLPVTVSAVPLLATGVPAGAGDSALDAFLDAHMFVMYTGKTRLAKNLLQRVLRQWALRENDVTTLVAELRSNALAMARAVAARDAPRVGACLDVYWDQKKRMAPMAEPPEVTDVIAALAPLIHGASLTGAGGGGFLFGISRAPHDVPALQAALAAHPATAAHAAEWTVLPATVDRQGLTLVVGDAPAA